NFTDDAKTVTREEVLGSSAVDNAPPHPQTIRFGDFLFVVGAASLVNPPYFRYNKTERRWALWFCSILSQHPIQAIRFRLTSTSQLLPTLLQPKKVGRPTGQVSLLATLHLKNTPQKPRVAKS
ncbi:hypothetical protein C7J97_01345, partial [Faecalibacterium prausnitzii]